MSRKKNGKPYWEMTTEELLEATKQFDEEFVAERSKPLTPEMKALWEQAKGKSRGRRTDRPRTRRDKRPQP
jgi:hypothetical protein